MCDVLLRVVRRLVDHVHGGCKWVESPRADGLAAGFAYSAGEQVEIGAGVGFRSAYASEDTSLGSLCTSGVKE
jgi:hypothetical protein